MIVIQPPEIRHRVLYASDNIEVLEIGVPAEHVTTIDHDMTLPNGPANPDRGSRASGLSITVKLTPNGRLAAAWLYRA